MNARYTVKLHDTDASGRLFFANQFKIVHDVYQKFMEKIGYGLSDRLLKKDFYLPIRYAEADFLQPLQVDDDIIISLAVAKVGKSSFTLAYELTNQSGDLLGTARTVHTTVDPVTGKKIALPETLKEKLQKLAAGS